MASARNYGRQNRNSEGKRQFRDAGYYLFPHSESNQSKVTFKPYDGIYHLEHDEQNRFIPFLNKELDNDYAKNVFYRIFKERMDLAEKESGGKGVLQLILSFGVTYVFSQNETLVKGKVLTIDEFNDLFKPKPYRHIKQTFKPKPVNKAAIMAFLERNNFQKSKAETTYQVTVKTEDHRQNDILSLDENMEVTNIRLSDEKWLVADVCRGIDKERGSKRMDARIKFISRKFEDPRTNENLLNLNIIPGQPVIKPDKIGDIFVDEHLLDKIKFVRHKESTYFQCNAAEGVGSRWEGVTVNVANINEHSNLDTIPRKFTKKVNSCEIMVYPSFPGFELTDAERNEFIGRIWNMMQELIDVIE